MKVRNEITAKEAAQISGRDQKIERMLEAAYLSINESAQRGGSTANMTASNWCYANPVWLVTAKELVSKGYQVKIIPSVTHPYIPPCTEISW